MRVAMRMLTTRKGVGDLSLSWEIKAAQRPGEGTTLHGARSWHRETSRARLAFISQGSAVVEARVTCRYSQQMDFRYAQRPEAWSSEEEFEALLSLSALDHLRGQAVPGTVANSTASRVVSSAFQQPSGNIFGSWPEPRQSRTFCLLRHFGLSRNA